MANGGIFSNKAGLGRRFGTGMKPGPAKTKKIQSAARALSVFATRFPSTFRGMSSK